MATTPPRRPTSVKVLLALVAASVTLAALSLGGQYVRFFLGHDTVFGLIRQFDVDSEANLPSWYSSALLAASALLLGVAARASRKRREGVARDWEWLAGVFVFLSIDEMAQFHEMLIGPVRAIGPFNPYFHFAWVIPGLVFTAAVGVASIGFLRSIPRRTAWMFVVAGLIYVSGAIGMEMIDGHYFEVHHLSYKIHNGTDFTYAVLVTIEELLEMLGAGAMVYALLDYLERAGIRVRVDAGPEPGPGGG